MSKSKRKSKTRRQTQLKAEAAVQAEPMETAASISGSDYKSAIAIGLVVIVTVIAVYAMIAAHSGGIGGQVHNPSSQASIQTGLPEVQSGNTQSLSPSGSVNLQPTSSSAQAGSVQ